MFFELLAKIKRETKSQTENRQINLDLSFELVYVKVF